MELALRPQPSTPHLQLQQLPPRRPTWDTSSHGGRQVTGGAVVCGIAARLRRLPRFRARPSWCRTALAALSTAPTTVEELRGLRLRELKKALGNCGLDVSGCFDKESLLELLKPEGTAERVLASLQAAAEAARPKIFDVPLVVEENVFIALDLKLGPAGTVARFSVDTSTPFTTVLGSWAKSQGAVGISGTTPPQVTMGEAFLGDLNCGEFRAVPVEMAVPPGCSGVLSFDFLSKFDWEFDVQNCKVRVAKVPNDPSVPVPFDVENLQKLPVELQVAKNRAMGGYPIKLLKAPLKLARKGSQGAEMLLGSLGDFSVACEAYILFASVSACSKEVAEAMALGGEDYPGKGKQIKTPNGQIQSFQDYSLYLALGDGPDGPIKLTTEVCVDHPGLQMLEFTGSKPAAIIGLDVLSRARLVYSPREMAMWMRADLA